MATMASVRAGYDHGNEVWLLKLTLDQCTLENKYMYAAAATCTATSKCYYTYYTCKDLSNYTKGTKTWQFCSQGAFILGAYPYLKGPGKSVPTEINPEKFKTVRGEMVFELVADTAEVLSNPDKLFDSGKASDKAESAERFLPAWVKRNENYRGRIAELYYGFDTVDSANYELRFRGVIDNIEYTPKGAKIKCKDLLWEAALQETPAKIPEDITVNDNPLGAADVTLTLDKNGSTNFTASDYFETPDYDSGAGTVNQYRFIKIENEIIAYRGITDGAGAALTTLIRGVMGTTAASHAQGTTIKQVCYYGETNASDSAFSDVDGLPPDHILLDLLCNHAGIDASYINLYTSGSWTVNGAHNATVTSISVNSGSTLPSVGVGKINNELVRWTANSSGTLTVLRGCYGTTAAAHSDTDDFYPVDLTYWFGEYMQGSIYRARFENSKKVSELVNSFRKSTMIHMWINEDGEVESKLATPWYSATPNSYTKEDMIDGQRKISRNEEYRYTRFTVWYNPPNPDAGESEDDYEGGDVRSYVDATAEGSDAFNEKREGIIYSPWIYQANEANLLAARSFNISGKARHSIEFNLETKDEGTEKTGSIIEVTVPEIVDEGGTEDSGYYLVIKKLLQAMLYSLDRNVTAVHGL